MAMKILRVVGTVIGVVSGIYLFEVLLPVVAHFIGIPPYFVLSPASIGYFIFGAVLLGFIFFIITPLLINLFIKMVSRADTTLKAVPTQDIALAVLSLITTLLIGLLLSYPIYRIPVVGVFIAPVITLFLVFIGVRFAFNRKEEFTFLTSLFSRNVRQKGRENELYKILDTSAIIDGRIVDICKTGFLEGIIVVAGFVLEELQHIADSPDLLKRNRGRRGLDVLNKIQKEMDIPVQIYEGDFEDVSEVDSKLVKLAKKINGKIVTNDFNLN